MKLELWISWVKDDDYNNPSKEKKIYVNLPNKDMHYLYEAWRNLSHVESIEHFEAINIDNIIEQIYNIVLESLYSTVGLTEKMYHDGIFEIDDPATQDSNNASATITIYT